MTKEPEKPKPGRLSKASRLKTAFKKIMGTPKKRPTFDLQSILDEAHFLDLSRAEQEILSNFMRTRVLSVHHIMVARSEIQAVSVDSPFEDLVNLMVSSAKTRLPVYKDTLDNIVGMVHIKDVLAQMNAHHERKLAPLIRPVIFAAPSMHSIDLLLRMRGSATHLALVVDEYGGIDGLVTLEDLVEQIVGDIVGEHENLGTPQMIWQVDNTLLVDARIQLDDLEKELGSAFFGNGNKEIKTLGGIIFAQISRVPSRGEMISHKSGLVFKIIEADARRIQQILITNIPGDA